MTGTRAVLTDELVRLAYGDTLKRMMDEARRIPALRLKWKIRSVRLLKEWYIDAGDLVRTIECCDYETQLLAELAEAWDE